jgi:hypothetical protein
MGVLTLFSVFFFLEGGAITIFLETLGTSQEKHHFGLPVEK